MYFIGIDIGGTNTKVGLVSEDYELLKFLKIPTSQDIIDNLVDEIKEFFKENSIGGIGIGVAGLFKKDGCVFEFPNIPCFN